MSTNYYAEHAWSDLSNSCLKEKQYQIINLSCVLKLGQKYRIIKKKIDMYV